MLEFLESYWWIVIVLFIGGIITYIFSLFKKVEQGKVLIISGVRGIRAVFDGTIVIPILEKMEIMDISVQKIEVEQTGKEGVSCRNNIKMDIKMSFNIRVNTRMEDIMTVAQVVGCQRASDQNTLDSLFKTKFLETIKTVSKQFSFRDIQESQEQFKMQIMSIIGADLNGYVLDDCAIEYAKQTPLKFLDPDNILDAEGIKIITEITMMHKMHTNEIRREALMVNADNIESKTIDLIEQLEEIIAFSAENNMENLRIFNNGKNINIQTKTKEDVKDIIQTEAKLVYVYPNYGDKDLYIIKPI